MTTKIVKWSAIFSDRRLSSSHMRRSVLRRMPSLANKYPGYRSGDAIEEAAHELDYIVHGKSFLRYMVRKIVGTLLEVGRGKLAPSDISAIFDSRDRSRSGPTVPPDGLYLVSLEYPDPTASLAHERRKSEAKIG